MQSRPLSRRRFLASASAAVAATRCLADSPAAPFRLRYLLASCMYGTLPLAEIVPQVAATGAEGIDLWPKVHGNQREQADELGRDAFRALLDRHSVKLSMTTRYDLGPFKLREEVDYLSQFGGSLIVTGSSKASGKGLKEDVREFVDKLQPHVEYAESKGVTIGIENHANALIESADSIRYLAEFAMSPRLGIALAPYHLPQNPAVLAGLIRDLGPKLVHFYAWEHGDGCHVKLPKEQELKQLPGRGPLDFGPVLAALREIRFAGWTEVFMHPVPRGVPILDSIGDVTAAINRSREYLDAQLRTGEQR